MKNNVEESSSSEMSDSERESEVETESEEVIQKNESENEDVTKKFDLSQVQKRLENGPPSSSDEDESDVENDDPESEADDEAEDEAEDNNDENEKNSGWANAMAKVLNTGKNTQTSKPLLLSKAKKDEQKHPGLDAEKNSKEKPSIVRAKKKELENLARKRPDIVKDRIKEKKLSKIATRGVVQLFNAVREQQKTIKTQLDKAGLSTTKRDKVYKNLDKEAFLEVLSGKKRNLSSLSAVNNSKLNNKKFKTEVKTEDHENNIDDDGTWSVLKDNFMMGAKMKDWDKESDNE